MPLNFDLFHDNALFQEGGGFKLLKRVREAAHLYIHRDQVEGVHFVVDCPHDEILGLQPPVHQPGLLNNRYGHYQVL